MLYREECYTIVGAAMEVHRCLGRGFTEYVYQDALELELKKREVPFEREKTIAVNYKGTELKHGYVADFLCYGEIILELKAVSELDDVHRAQLINYLKATGRNVGLLMNFGKGSLQYERIIYT